MPKKDTASAILGMLSSTGAHTRPAGQPAQEGAQHARPVDAGEHVGGEAGGEDTKAVSGTDDPVTPADPRVDEQANAATEASTDADPQWEAASSGGGDASDSGEQPKNVRMLPVSGGAQKAPLTVRLTPEAAQILREAWLDAKRDDVLLSATDFASAVVLSSLKSRKRAASRANSRG